MKRCRDGSRFRPFADFPHNRLLPHGCGIYCKACFAVRGRAGYERRRAAVGKTVRTRVSVPDGMKRCPACTEVKVVEEFPRNRSALGGRGGSCKPCHSAKGKATYTRLYGGTRHYHLQRRYGISAARVDDLVSQQGGLCAICREAPAAHVDHEHLTGCVRGVLCFNCNGGLGQCKDRADVLKQAVAYLEEHAWRTLVAPGVYRLSS